MKNWKTTLGGALSALGTSLAGIGSVTSISSLASTGNVNQAVIWLTLSGFVISAVGKFFGGLFAADATKDDSSGNGVGKIVGLLLAVSLLAGVVIVSQSGCTTTQQAMAYKTLYTVEKTTVAAYDGYIDAVILGAVPTNGVPKVSKAFNHFQASFLVALDAVQFNTNALAPGSLVVESQDLINLIQNVKGK